MTCKKRDYQLSSCLSVSVSLLFCMSVCSHLRTRLPLDGFSYNFILVCFTKMYGENWIFINICQEYRLSYVKAHSHCCNNWILLRMRNVSGKSYRGNQNTHFVLIIFFFRKSCRLWDKVDKYCTVGQAADDNRAHAHSMKYKLGYRYTHRIRNTFCFSAATVVMRTYLSVTFIRPLARCFVCYTCALYLCFLKCAANSFPGDPWCTFCYIWFDVYLFLN